MAKGKIRYDGPMSTMDYECEEDLRAIARADACKADPKRMAAVKKLAKTKLDDNKRRKDEAQKMIDMAQEA